MYGRKYNGKATWNSRRWLTKGIKDKLDWLSHRWMDEGHEAECATTGRSASGARPASAACTGVSSNDSGGFACCGVFRFQWAAALTASFVHTQNNNTGYHYKYHLARRVRKQLHDSFHLGADGARAAVRAMLSDDEYMAAEWKKYKAVADGK